MSGPRFRASAEKQRAGRRRAIRGLVAATTVSIVLGACGAASERTGGESVPDNGTTVPVEVSEALQNEGEVVVLDLDFSSATVQALLIAHLLEKMGGEATTMKMADHYATWAAVENDDNMVNPEVWDMYFGPQIADYIEDRGTVVSLGTAHLSGTQGWHVPTYVIEGDEERGIEPMCPGLPDYQALNDCADVFATAGTGDKGRFLTGTAAWVDYYGDEQRIANLGLNYEVEVAGSEAALVGELKRAYDRGEPWLGLMWEPHYATLRYDLTLIEFPPFSEDCWGDTYACGWDEQTFLRVASSGFLNQHPTAAAFIQGFDITDEHMAEILIAIEDDGLSEEEAVEDWIENHAEVWEQWVPVAPAT